MYNSSNNKDKMITHRGLDCCASLNIGGGALLALHWRAPVGTSLQQLLFHNLINSNVNSDHWSPSFWMFSQWFFTRVLHCYHWPSWIYSQRFFTHLVVSSSWQVDFITLMQTWNETGALCFLTLIELWVQRMVTWIWSSCHLFVDRAALLNGDIFANSLVHFSIGATRGEGGFRLGGLVWRWLGWMGLGLVSLQLWSDSWPWVS